MNTIKLFTLLLLLAVALQAQSDQSAASMDSLVDVFPLTLGRVWTYGYDYEYRDSGRAIDFYSDTGNVVIQVIDLEITNDSIIWKLREAGTHWTKTNSLPWTGPTEEIDTFEIIELKEGNHRLYRQEVEKAVMYSVFPFLQDLADTARVYRYATVDTSGCKYISTCKEPVVPTFRFTFKKDLGLTDVAYSDGCLCLPFDWTKHSLRSSLIVGIQKPGEKLLPKDYSLNQNYPNPFNPTTLISYSLPKQSNVAIIIYDALGREVTVLVNEEKEAGRYEVEFGSADGSQQSASGISSKGGYASGVYFYQIRAGDFIQTKKMILLR